MVIDATRNSLLFIFLSSGMNRSEIRVELMAVCQKRGCCSEFYATTLD